MRLLQASRGVSGLNLDSSSSFGHTVKYSQQFTQLWKGESVFISKLSRQCFGFKFGPIYFSIPVVEYVRWHEKNLDVSRWKNFWTSLILIFRQLICSDRNNIPVIGNYSQIVNLSKAYINRKSKRLFEQATYEHKRRSLAPFCQNSILSRSCHILFVEV